MYEINNEKLKKFKKGSIDFGMVNLISLFTTLNERPLIIDGKHIISINKDFKYKIAKVQKQLDDKPSNFEKKSLKDIHHKLLIKREKKINNYFHQISEFIIKYCKKKKINELILGYNINWKQNIKMGKKNNFNFSYIPYKKLVNFLFYKGVQNGIQIKETEESYTSKCDSFALEEIKKHDSYTDKRIKRGLF